MSFTPYKPETPAGGIPEISISMKPMHTESHYSSEGMSRAVVSGPDGRPIGKVEDTPPYDLLAAENAGKIRAMKAKREMEQAKKAAPAPVPPPPIDPGDALRRANADLIGRKFSYISSEKFGQEVAIERCSLNAESQIVIHMSDGFETPLDDLEINFIPALSDLPNSPAPASQPQAVAQPKLESKAPQQAVNMKFVSNLPASPLQDLLKTRKKNPSKLDVELSIDLVKSDFFKIIDDSYENAIDYVVEHVMNSFTIEDVKNAIKKKLIGIYGIVEEEVSDVETADNNGEAIYSGVGETIILEKDKSSK